MGLSSGTMLGPYEIVGALGAGGMGEVYRARDTKLGREVAVKILPDEFAADPERLARFRREAQLLASLNHPHIAAIYGFEESAGERALVLELVEGPTLADRLARGAIPIEEAVPIARQICDALESAHERSVIHRDLKPANIKLTADGNVKVLDFGLAKLVDTGSGGSGVPGGLTGSGGLSMSPTLSVQGTLAGVILGTAAYMSPEQARGKPADKRADVWAFGCVLFEMLTGKQPFEIGENVSDAVAAILKNEPEWAALPAETPQRIRRLLRRCLQKDPRARLRDIGDARLELIDDAEPESLSPARHSPPRLTRAVSIACVSALAGITVGAGAILFGTNARARAPREPVVFQVAPPGDSVFTGRVPQLAVSPDGRLLAFVATARGVPMLHVRSFGGVDVKPLSGTEQATYPFWSPDSRSIGFFAGGKLKRVDVAGGSPLILCDAVDGRGGSWSRDNTILFVPAPATALWRVSSSGGKAIPVTTAVAGPSGGKWPFFLPDGRHFLSMHGSGGDNFIVVASLDSPAWTKVVDGSMAAYSAPHLFFWRNRNLVAQRFDAESLRLEGDPFLVAEDVAQEGPGYASFSVSENGVLVYAPSVTGRTTLTWHDRAGRVIGRIGDAADGRMDVSLSPVDDRVATSFSATQGGAPDIWLLDPGHPTGSRFTFNPGADALPTWSPDGAWIAFASSVDGGRGLYRKMADGSGAEQLLLKFQLAATSGPTDWSRDGRFIAFVDTHDVFALPLFGDRKPIAIAQTTFNEDNGVFAPDGRWIAYTSNESGREEIYVQTFPPTGGKWQVSRDGGTRAAWRRDGKELFFLAPDGRLMAAPIDATGRFSSRTPQALFAAGLTDLTNSQNQPYAVSRDGERFLLMTPENSKPPTLTAIIGWSAPNRR